MYAPLITRAGYQRLQDELTHLWRVERREITQKVAWAASLGDRSENADYHANKRRLREIDRRIRYLKKRLAELRIVDPSPEQSGRVFFGAQVDIEDEEGAQMCFRILGYDEIFHHPDAISIDAPMARALLGKSEGDEALVRTPEGKKTWFINKITYP
jgi:transcription elongation factor GreB